jgi:oxidase EvaA
LREIFNTILCDNWIRSALALDGEILSESNPDQWLESFRERDSWKVTRVPFAALDAWCLQAQPRRIAHGTGQFFTVEGLRVNTDFGHLHTWDQPIMRQPEIGILGILTVVVNGIRYFLMQAKAEPGNINGAQLAPTVQATFSNYTRVHGGRPTPFLDYFSCDGHARVIVDCLQGEKGFNFLSKQNRNMIVEIDEPITPPDRFCWLTLGQIKQLLRRDDQVNMDTRSVLACLPWMTAETIYNRPDLGENLESYDGMILSNFATELLRSAVKRGTACHDYGELLAWLAAFRERYSFRVSSRPLDQLEGWHYGEMEIEREESSVFSVVGIEVEAVEREVDRWYQPMFAYQACGLHCLVLQSINGTLHLLMQACFSPGNRRMFEIGPTISCLDLKTHLETGCPPALYEVFNLSPREWIRYASIQSEEGGRFFRSRNRYIVLELPSDYSLQSLETHRWMTVAQVHQFLARGEISVEARSLFACLDLNGVAPDIPEFNNT